MNEHKITAGIVGVVLWLMGTSVYENVDYSKLTHYSAGILGVLGLLMILAVVADVLTSNKS